MIHIITDSMSDLLPEEAATINVEVMPLYLYFGEESFQDNISITRQDFYARMKTSKTLPKTSQVIPEAFFIAYQRALSSGYKVLVITGSSELSGTYQSAVIALDMLTEAERSGVHLMDSRSCALGEALLVGEAARLRDAGYTVEEIVRTMMSLIPYQTLIGQVEDLKYLVLGGRLPAIGGKIGTAFNLKPLIHLKSGKLEMAGVARGNRRSYEWFVQQLQKSPPVADYPVYFASADASEALSELLKYLEKKHALSFDYHIMGIGSIVGSHTGPGCVAASWIRRPLSGTGKADGK